MRFFLAVMTAKCVTRIKILCIFVLLCHGVRSEADEILEESETKDGAGNIIKQIKKVNDDGSYTFGYEAEDGTFKIESRDVLGNIKGTFGYIDADGEIKRVSYSTSNSTALPGSAEITTTLAPPTTTEPVIVQRISSTKRPHLVFPSPSSSTASSVIQTIPRRKPNASSLHSNSSSDNVVSSTTTTVRPSSLFYSTPAALKALQLTTQRSIRLKQEEADQQLARPIKESQVTPLPHLRRIVAKANNADAIKPINEADADEKERVRGNLLRRQLSQEKTPLYDHRSNANQQLLSLHRQSTGDDAGDVYTTGTPRPPLFTTTAVPPAISSSARILTSEPPPVTEASSASEPTYSPVVQIPRAPQGTILVPLHQLRNQGVLPDNPQQPNHYSNPGFYPQIFVAENGQPGHPQHHHQTAFIARNGVPSAPPQPQPAQIVVQRFVPQPSPAQVQIPIPIQQDDLSDINQIQPPVSTRDFQKLINQLIIRQQRLEQIQALTNNHRFGFSRPIFVPQQQPHQQLFVAPQQRIYNSQGYSVQQPQAQGSRRVARLLQHPQQASPPNEDYLPPDVREMLLLKMLQLAINPSLPLDDGGNLNNGIVEGVATYQQQVVTPPPPVPVHHHHHPHHHPQQRQASRRIGTRNVEILGEEFDEITTDHQTNHHRRSKRFRDGVAENDPDYYY